MTKVSATKTSATKFKLITGAKEIKAGIASYGKAGKALDDNAHVLACSVVAHCYEHGEISLTNAVVNSLIAAMPKSARVNSMRKFMETFAPVVYNSKDKLFVISKKKLDDARSEEGKIEVIIQEAINTPFYSSAMGKEPDYIPVNLPALVKSIIGKVERQQAKGLTDKDVVDNDMLETLRRLVA